MDDGQQRNGTALAGLRVVVTRPREQADEFVALLERRGAEPQVYPMIRIVAPEDAEPLRRAARSVAIYDWVVFTSVNGVKWFWRELEAAGGGAESFGGVRVAAIGPATAAAVRRRGVAVEVVPSKYVAESVVDALAEAHGGAGERPLAGTRVLLPRAAGARAVLRERLAVLGAEVDEVHAYRAVLDGRGADELRRRLIEGQVDVVTFTASSTVDNFVKAVGTELGRARVAVIGPITAATARRHGLRVDVEADEHTIPGLVEALCDAVDPQASTSVS